jgi:NADP-reducing hydrogenase subunit HndB
MNKERAMTRLDYETLKKIGAEKRNLVNRRYEKPDHPIILVGTGSCGVAAGARATIAAIRDQLEKSEVTAELKETGCMGLCYSEPTVEVIMPDMPTIIYGNVDEEVARKIVRKHIQKKQMINKHIFTRPAEDVLED